MERFSVDEIEEALGEAREECHRAPETDLWKSFWNRLTQGRYLPPDPVEKED